MTEINYREETRDISVCLVEDISNYYFYISNLRTLQNICKLIGVDEKLLNYKPEETDDDDDKYNYCGALSEIGRKDNK